MRAVITAFVLFCSAGIGLPPATAQQMGARPVITATPEPAPATQTAPVPPSQKGIVDPDYVIGPGDILEVNVFNEPKFSSPSLPVRPDGMISINLVGDIPASGYTATQLGQQVASHLRSYITDPSVTISVLGINSKHVYLVGEVAHVGPLAMSPGMTPLQAIATAGGPGPYANLKRVYILRNVGGKQQKIPFNYKKAIKDGDMQGVTLINGDTIVIP